MNYKNDLDNVDTVFTIFFLMMKSILCNKTSESISLVRHAPVRISESKAAWLADIIKLMIR